MTHAQPQSQLSAPAAPRRKRRVFLWVFLAIQVLFLIWIIAGAASSGPSTAAQAASLCDHHAWFPLYKSQAACLADSGRLLHEATDTGKGLGIALIVVFWCVVDFLVGFGYLIYRVASRRRYA